MQILCAKQNYFRRKLVLDILSTLIESNTEHITFERFKTQGITVKMNK